MARAAAATMPRSGARRTRRVAPRRRRGGTIRWDRVGRIALLIVLGGILLLYVSPLLAWRKQSAAEEIQRAEVQALEREHAELAGRLESLDTRGAIEREARALGMVKRGERALVIEGLPER